MTIVTHLVDSSQISYDEGYYNKNYNSSMSIPFPGFEMLPLLKDTNLFTEQLVGLSLIFFLF